MHKSASLIFALIMLVGALAAAPVMAEPDKPVHESAQIGLGIGRGMNWWLIQQDDITSAEVYDLHARQPVAAASWFDWVNVDSTFVEVHRTHLHGSDQGQSQTLDITGAAFVWRWYPPEIDHWFTEIGVGVAHLSDDNFEMIQTARRDNFVLDFAAGRNLPWGNESWQMSLRYRHYSNGYTHNPNPGIDYWSLSLDYLFK